MAASLIAGLMQKRPQGGQHLTADSIEAESLMPDSQDFLLSDTFLKCPFYSAATQTSWRPMFCCLSKDGLYLSKKKDEERRLDYIPYGNMESICTSVMLDANSQEDFHILEIQTVLNGANKGRKYKFRLQSQSDSQYTSFGERMEHWAGVLNTQAKQAKFEREKALRVSTWGRLSAWNKALHDSDRFQQFFGIVIMTSFFISIVQAEMTPLEGSFDDGVFAIIDLIFTALFTIEWIITLLGHFGLIFIQDSWRIFDTLVVFISLVSATGLPLPAVKSIRALRVLRAVRLLKKSKSLKPIVEALFASVMPVINSMVLLALVTAIYASMAVGLFGEAQPIMFGKFSRAMFTMFQACTGDGWATDITRVMFEADDGVVQPVPVFFFVSSC